MRKKKTKENGVGRIDPTPFFAERQSQRRKREKGENFDVSCSCSYSRSCKKA